MKSKKLLIIALAGAISFSLSVIVVVGTEFFNTRPKSSQMLENITGLHTLGYLNRLKAKSLNLEALFNNSSKGDILLFRENLRKIRHEVESSEARIILFSSLKANEGKSTAMFSMAYSLSLSLKKVLIIDTNFKSNGLTRLYNAKPVLEKYLAGSNIQPEQLISGTGFKNIDILGCEGGTYSPSEIFSQVDFKDLLQKLLTRYHYILIEGAPMLRYSDTKELLPYADKLVMVFSAENDVNHQDQEVLEYLKGLNTSLLGTVLNKVNLKEI